MSTIFVFDSSHYSQVLELAMEAQRTLWIGTADIKDLYISNGKAEKPFLGVLSDLIGKSVNVRLIHAKEPWQAFRKDFDKVWLGEMCKKCQRKQYCGYMIVYK